jgi:hypothetical protein
MFAGTTENTLECMPWASLPYVITSQLVLVLGACAVHLLLVISVLLITFVAFAFAAPCLAQLQLQAASPTWRLRCCSMANAPRQLTCTPLACSSSW